MKKLFTNQDKLDISKPSETNEITRRDFLKLSFLSILDFVFGKRQAKAKEKKETKEEYLNKIKENGMDFVLNQEAEKRIINLEVLNALIVYYEKIFLQKIEYYGWTDKEGKKHNGINDNFNTLSENWSKLKKIAEKKNFSEKKLKKLCFLAIEESRLDPKARDTAGNGVWGIDYNEENKKIARENNIDIEKTNTLLGGAPVAIDIFKKKLTGFGDIDLAILGYNGNFASRFKKDIKDKVIERAWTMFSKNTYGYKEKLKTIHSDFRERNIEKDKFIKSYNYLLLVKNDKNLKEEREIIFQALNLENFLRYAEQKIRNENNKNKLKNWKINISYLAKIKALEDIAKKRNKLK